MMGGFGKFLQSKNISRDQLVSRDDPEFKKEFGGYSSDQTDARYILSSSLMRRTLEFKKKTGRQISLSFAQANVYIALAYTKDLFEPNVFYFKQYGIFRRSRNSSLTSRPPWISLKI